MAGVLALVLIALGVWWARRGNDPLSLPKEDLAYLWDVEHHSNILGQRGLKALGAAIAAQDRELIERHLAEAFAGRLASGDRKLSLEEEGLSVSRIRQDEGELPSLDRQAFVDWLLSVRKKFPQPPQARFDIMKIHPATPHQLDGPWQVICLLRLWRDGSGETLQEVTSHWEITVDRPTKERVSEPGWLRECTVRQVAEVRSDRPLFQDVTSASGIDTADLHDNWTASSEPVVTTGNVYACDYNRDGWVDLLITDRNVGARLYRGGENGKFSDVTREALPFDVSSAADRGCAGLADLDNDGWEDIVVLGDKPLIARNEQGRSFRNVTAQSNISNIVATFGLQLDKSTGVIPGDFDRDGLIDLYLTRGLGPSGSWLESVAPEAPPCRLLRNLGDFQFADVTTAMHAEDGGRSVFSAAWFDANNDHWPDLYVINEFGDGVLLENQQGQSFKRHEIVTRHNDFGSMGLACGDIDNDGLIDIYTANMYSKAGSRVMANLPPKAYAPPVMDRLRSMVAGSELHLNQGEGRFQQIGKKYQVHSVGWSWGPALADLNNDGWLDLYVPAGFISRDRSKPDG